MFLFEFLGWRFLFKQSPNLLCLRNGGTLEEVIKDVVVPSTKSTASGSRGNGREQCWKPIFKVPRSPHFLLKTIPYEMATIIFPVALASGRRRRCCWTSALAREPLRWRCSYCRTVGIAWMYPVPWRLREEDFRNFTTFCFLNIWYFH